MLFFFTLGEDDYVPITTELSFTFPFLSLTDGTELTECIEFVVLEDSNPLESTEQFTINATTDFLGLSASATIVILNNGK